jgi:hypothetical protein
LGGWVWEEKEPLKRGWVGKTGYQVISGVKPL